MFDCPHCRQTLSRVSGKGSNYWKCENCGGHAMAVSLLRRSVEARVINELWQTAQKPSLASRLSCPSCQRAMKVVPLVLERNAFDVDVCQRCQFFWFDSSELQSLPKAPDAPAAPEKELPAA